MSLNSIPDSDVDSFHSTDQTRASSGSAILNSSDEHILSINSSNSSSRADPLQVTNIEGVAPSRLSLEGAPLAASATASEAASSTAKPTGDPSNLEGTGGNSFASYIPTGLAAARKQLNESRDRSKSASKRDFDNMVNDTSDVSSNAKKTRDDRAAKRGAMGAFHMSRRGNKAH